MRFEWKRYEEVLLRFIAQRDESTLSEAYMLGRQAMEAGVGIGEISRYVFESARDLSQELAPAAFEFLMESVAPFEMALRGYREAAQSLHRLNENLNAEIEQRTRELATSQEQLRQAQKLDTMGRLAGGIAHDFNNILSAVLTYSNVVLDEVAEDTEIYSDVVEIKRAAERGSALTKQLLAFSGRQVVYNQPVETRSAIEALVQMLRRLVPEKVTISLELGDSALYCLTGRGQLEQVVMNLVLNACDAVSGPGRVTVKLAQCRLSADEATLYKIRSGEYVRIEVSDDGEGIPPELQEVIFEPFFTTKEAGKGTGLGLPTVLNIVSGSGGTIRVESQNGQGTTFIVWLPAWSPESAEDGLAT